MNFTLVRYNYTDLALRARHRNEHMARLARLAERGIVILAGPTSDGVGAVIVFAAKEGTSARALMEADPYVVNGAITAYSLHPFDAVVKSPFLSLGD